jgi:hypothetical protein
VSIAEKSETNARLFVFSWSRSSLDLELQPQHNGTFVESVPSFVIFIFVVAVFLLLPKILELLSK